MSVAVDRTAFGSLPDGTPIYRYTLTGARGASVSVMPYGASVVSVRVPDRAGRIEDVVLGFATLEPYLAPHGYFGAIVGRYANRIAGSAFELDGETFRLAPNDGPHHLHGGPDGMHRQIWQLDPLSFRSEPHLTLRCSSLAGAGGYPGRLDATVEYRWSETCELQIRLTADCDRTTIVNLTSHPYFNLRGRGDILGHRLRIGAESYLPVDADLIPTGELRSVAGTPFDFRVPRAIGERIDRSDEQLAVGAGYDHCYVLQARDDESTPVAEVSDPLSGRTLRVSTSQPGLQFYSGNHLTGTAIGHGGAAYARRSGFCLEAQHFPDSPHRGGFPSTVLRPGETYRQTTVYAFGVA